MVLGGKRGWGGLMSGPRRGGGLMNGPRGRWGVLWAVPRGGRGLASGSRRVGGGSFECGSWGGGRFLMGEVPLHGALGQLGQRHQQWLQRHPEAGSSWPSWP